MEPDLNLRNFQKLMKELYFDRDQKRGIDKTMVWFVEEVGELARALRKKNDPQNLREEFADAFAWLCSLANLSDIDLLEAAYEKYPFTCSKCKHNPCICAQNTN